MTKQQRYEAVAGAYVPLQKGEKTISILREDMNTEVRNTIMEIQRNLKMNFDLSYEVMADACAQINDTEYKDIAGLDPFDGEYASVYTWTQLQYLDANNQYDITEVLKENDCDIATACAIWYDRKVYQAVDELKALILQ